MTGKSNIEWTEQTWNPIVGCSIVSPGCTNCYAMKMAARIEAMGNQPRYAGTTRKVNGNAIWTGKLAQAPESALLAPLKRKKPTTYFVNSMGDLFHEDCPDEWIDRVFAVMALSPQHTFQVLTKRAGRMKSYFNRYDAPHDHNCADMIADAAATLQGKTGARGADRYNGKSPGWPLPNVWLGVSTERQQEYDSRKEDMRNTPAAVRFFSMEPLLGPIEPDYLGDWVIVGGESGPKARPMHPHWAHDLRDDCARAGVPFFFKQWGEWAPGECADKPMTRTERGATWFNDEWSYETITPRVSQETHYEDAPDVYRLGKKAAGRHLDGELHNALPVRA